MTDRLTNGRTDICERRVAFATEKFSIDPMNLNPGGCLQNPKFVFYHLGLVLVKSCLRKVPENHKLCYLVLADGLIYSAVI